jgi:hypothetical protein
MPAVTKIAKPRPRQLSGSKLKIRRTDAQSPRCRGVAPKMLRGESRGRAARQKASGMAITAPVPESRRPSSFGVVPRLGRIYAGRTSPISPK